MLSHQSWGYHAMGEGNGPKGETGPEREMEEVERRWRRMTGFDSAGSRTVSAGCR